MRHRLLTSAAIFGVLLGCTTDSAALELPTQPPNAVLHEQRLEGITLQFDGLGCVWLVDEDGTRYAATWPHGYYARTDPRRILDARGRVVARDGEVLIVGGGPGPAVEGACGDRNTWWVGEVEAERE